MFDSHQKSTGTGYTTTVALLAVAFIFSPAFLVVSHPFGYLTLALATASSTLCVTLAWFHWKKSSQLTIPSIVMQRSGDNA
jgi:hypothetical protein